MPKTTFFAVGIILLVAVIIALIYGKKPFGLYENESSKIEDFLSANNQFVDIVETIENQSTGKVTTAKFERDIGNGNSHIEFEVILDDGGEQEYIFNTINNEIFLQKDTLEVFISQYELLDIVKSLEKSTGGKLVEAEFEDTLGDGTTHIELDIKMPDGSEQEYIFDTVSKTLAL